MKDKLVLGFLVILVFSVSALGVNAYLVRRELMELRSSMQNNEAISAFSETPVQTTPPVVATSGADVRSYVDTAIASISAQLMSTPKPSATKTPVVTATSSQKVTSYITLNGNNFSTKNTDWVDVPGAEVWIDVATDYGGQATLSWDAFIREEHGNGDAYARLYDATHNIEVPGSVISTNNQASTLVVSSGLTMWSGRNLYKVQMKSQKSFYVFFDSGRIRITY